MASDGLGRPLAALILSDFPPKRDEDHWEKKEEEEEEVNNATEKVALEKREAQREENDKAALKEDKTQDGIKEMLELATGLEVQNNSLSNKVLGVFFSGVTVHHSSHWPLPLPGRKVSSDFKSSQEKIKSSLLRINRAQSNVARESQLFELLIKKVFDLWPDLQV